jgi:hypothetical protein
VSNREEIIWAAGLFEGEGTIGCWRQPTSQRNGVTLTTRIVMTDEDIMHRFADALDSFGLELKINKAGRLYGGEKKLRYTIQTYQFEKSQAIITMFWSWLGSRRRKQAIDSLTKYRNYYGF